MAHCVWLEIVLVKVLLDLFTDLLNFLSGILSFFLNFFNYLKECYVADEIITTRANKRVRVGNTVRSIFY